MLTIKTPLKNIPKISAKYQKVLEKLGLFTVEDFLFYLPFRYDDFSKTVSLSNEFIDQIITVEGKILKAKNNRLFRRNMTITEIISQDENGNLLKTVWFNQPYILENFPIGTLMRFSGKLGINGKYFSMSNPAFEKSSREKTNTGGLIPIYNETAGITSKWIRWQMKNFLPLAKDIPEILSEEIRKKYNLYDIQTALTQLHFPTSYEKIIIAQKRMAFQEMLLVQLKSLQIRKDWEGKNSCAIKFDEKLIENFVKNLPFQLTNAQKKASFEILKDLEKPRPMNRLLNGDVGSGKTIVAGISALQTISVGYQTAIMAPTEVLARQHFLSFCELFKNHNFNIALLTNSYKLISKNSSSPLGRGCRVTTTGEGSYQITRDELLKNILENKINLIIGTHALIQKDISFGNLALVIIDEQHRFGVNQRASLVAQTNADATQTDTENLLYKDLTYKIRGAIFAVKKQLGLGHKEIIYQKALEEELKNCGLNFQKEKSIDIKYNNKKIGIYRPDFIVENKIILELKAIPFLGKIEKQQIWNYLKGSEYKLALLINFGREDVQIERFIYTKNKSVLSQRPVSISPHLLTMTATPIPRTLAIAYFGSLDLSILDEMPRNRLPIITKIITPLKQEGIYAFIEKEIERGRQIFVIFPLVEESKSAMMSEVKAATEEHKKLEKIFPEFRIGLLHGRLPAKGGSASGGKSTKESIMNDFKNRKFDILVSTSVVEVGIDIPNASVMIIENAERFGLTQLHQFRGRVGRGAHQSYCFLFSEKKSKRLSIMERTNDGFKIAEHDLRLRGPGQFFGTIQSGLPDITMENLSNMKLIKFAQSEASELLKTDPKLEKHPLLANALQKFEDKVHLE